METKEEINKRFETLIKKGNELLGTLGPDSYVINANGETRTDYNSYPYWVPKVRVPEFRAWLTSASSLIHFVSLPDAPLVRECDLIMTDEDLQRGMPSSVLTQICGLLIGAKDEWDNGSLGKIEYIFAGETFDNFLDHAAEYHKGNRKIEASILASAVLEDTMKKIAQKNGVSTSGKALDPLIDELVKANVFRPVKAKSVKANAGVRNLALHAEWDKFDISDVGKLIVGTKELIENYL